MEQPFPNCMYRHLDVWGKSPELSQGEKGKVRIESSILSLLTLTTRAGRSQGILLVYRSQTQKPRFLGAGARTIAF